MIACAHHAHNPILTLDSRAWISLEVKCEGTTLSSFLDCVITDVEEPHIVHLPISVVVASQDSDLTIGYGCDEAVVTSWEGRWWLYKSPLSSRLLG